jgi:RNA recognition motif-containing protein
MTLRLFVGNLGFSLSDETLRDAFAEVGSVIRAEVVRDRFSGRSRGFGFVEMSTAAEAERAAKERNGRELMGRPMRVEAATSDRGGPRRGRIEV